MKPFLQQVAEHYFAEGGMEQLCFVFPGRRAMNFFKKYLGHCVEASGTGKPLVAPQMMAVSDFWYRTAGVRPADRVKLLLDLYEEYRALRGQAAEPLDDFIFWGDVILSDFNDADKYLVDPSHLFANVADYKNIQDNFSYLTDAQRQAIENFLGHFSTDVGLYKQRFLHIWDILYELYRNFGRRLRDQGLSYDGQVYRSVAGRLDGESAADILAPRFPDTRKWIFVGLNALNECEKKLMRRMRDGGLAEFCWDFSSTEIRNPDNKSSFFLRGNLEEFPQAFKPDSGEPLPKTEFHVLSIPSGVGQAKQIPAILDSIGAKGIETAIVLPDEGLLLPVLNSIPERIEKLNVTMGYPMNGSEFWSLMNDAAALQLHTRLKDGQWYFYHRPVWSLFSNSVLRTALGEENAKKADALRKDSGYYIPRSAFEDGGIGELLFRPVVKDSSSQDPAQIAAIIDWQMDLITGIAPLLPGMEMGIELDFAKAYWQTLDNLRRFSLPLRPASYFRLLGQLMGGAAVPFHGEPLEGLQIMGPLETRALDFDNLIILSCNEGTFPRRSVSSSFIPPELRKGFGLPTYEYQDAVWAYYFYRMIQRAGKVWLLYDSRTEGLHSGEESRYIKQLQMHFGAPLTRHVASAEIKKAAADGDIPKTAGHLEILREGHLSASALQDWLSCPAKFYFRKVCALREEDEVSESLDSGMIGNVFHRTMQELYSGHRTISRSLLDALIKDKDGISRTVRANIMKELRSIEVAGRNIIFEGVIGKYVLKALQRDRELLDTYGVEEFRILGLELKRYSEIGGYKFKGYIDRLDSFRPGEVRIVDYKTGMVTDNDISVNDANAAEVADLLFGEDNSKRPKIALQLFLYDLFATEDKDLQGMQLVNSIYQTSRLFVEEVKNVPVSGTFMELCRKRIETDILGKIDDLGEPWRRTADQKTCAWCDFKKICSR